MNKQEAEAKRYDIEKISDIFQIPEDRFHLFIDDLLQFYSFGRNITNLIETAGQVVGMPVTALPHKMTWIDDNKGEIKITLKTTSQNKKGE